MTRPGDRPEDPPEDGGEGGDGGKPRRELRRRLLWFAGLWAGGVLTLAAVAYGIRLWLGL